MILVTGGAGAMGSRLVRALVDGGHRVRALTLPGDPAVDRLAGVDCEIASADIADAPTLSRAFAGVTTVYHLAAVIVTRDVEALWRTNVDGTRNVVAAAAAAGAQHIVFVSSVSAAEPDRSDYARSKMAGERAVKTQKRMAWTVVRPALVYGPDGGMEFALFRTGLLRYPVVPFIGRGRARKNPVHVDDVIGGLVAIAGNTAAHGKTYNFTGGEVVTMWDLAHLILAAEGRSKLFVPVPVAVCRAAAFLMEKTMRAPPLTRYALSRVLHDAIPDNDEARRDLGYRPIGVREGLRRSFARAGRPGEALPPQASASSTVAR